jgi:DHA2 family multidrug resistance protein
MSAAEAAAPAAGATWKPRYNPWLIAVAVTLAAFMEILDTTIVNVALPHIAGSLSSSSDEATWALTSYLVANGIVLTISGWLAICSDANATSSSASRCSRSARFCAAPRPA